MAYTPINWAENLEVDATKLDKMDNQIDANDGRITNNDGRITNLENYVVGNTPIFQSLSEFSAKPSSYVTAKEILVGKGGNARLTFEAENSFVSQYFKYRILVDGSEVANGGHSGRANTWVNYTEDINFQSGSNIKIQIRPNDTADITTVNLRNFRFKIGNQSDNIMEL